MKSDAIIGVVQGVTKKWAKQRKAEERKASREAYRYERRTYRRITIKDVAWDVMEEAYMKASAGGRLPAHARQVMYQARPAIQERTGQQLNDQYFTQTLLPDYIIETGTAWDVVFDDRGHFTEPHTELTIGLGTLSVRGYLGNLLVPKFEELSLTQPKLETQGPTQRFGAVLFVEKEGFMPLFEEAKLAERFDLAIMSTKGVSNIAARNLVDQLCGGFDLPLLTLHDFDKAGFTILGTLQRATRRYAFRHQLNVIDLGLRLADVEELGLDAESAFDRGSESRIRSNLRQNGATPEEIEFLLDQRVELNALPSDQLIEWIEGKLKDNGIGKVVPDKNVLSDAYQRIRAAVCVERKVESLIEKAKNEIDEAVVPENLEQRVRQALDDDPALPWDKAIDVIASDDVGDDE